MKSYLVAAVVLAGVVVAVALGVVRAVSVGLLVWLATGACSGALLAAPWDLLAERVARHRRLSLTLSGFVAALGLLGTVAFGLTAVVVLFFPGPEDNVAEGILMIVLAVVVSLVARLGIRGFRTIRGDQPHPATAGVETHRRTTQGAQGAVRGTVITVAVVAAIVGLGGIETLWGGQ